MVGHGLGERCRPVTDWPAVTTAPPAPLLAPGAEADDLRADLTRDVARSVNADPGRDADVLARATASALERVAVRLDLPSPYPNRAAVPATVYDVAVGVGAALVKRPSSAYGVAGYDDVDPLATRAIATLLADLVPSTKARWGLS